MGPPPTASGQLAPASSSRSSNTSPGSTPRGRTDHSAICPRQRSRIGHAKAIGTVKHSILIAAWHMLTRGELYTDLSPDYYRRRDPARTTKRLIAQLQALGHNVTLQEAAA